MSLPTFAIPALTTRLVVVCPACAEVVELLVASVHVEVGDTLEAGDGSRRALSLTAEVNGDGDHTCPR